MKKTRYTCPFLMHIALYLYKVKLWKTHRVYWKSPSDGRGGAYVVAQPRGKKGGWQLSCPFPKWMTTTEMRIRSTCLYLISWVRFPRQMLQHQKWKFETRKKQLAYEAKKAENRSI